MVVPFIHRDLSVLGQDPHLSVWYILGAALRDDLADSRMSWSAGLSTVQMC